MTEDTTIRPLTRARRDGTPYTREPEVEAQVRALSGIGPRERQRRIGLADRTQNEFLREETLVYLLREHDRQGDPDPAWQLAEILVGRVAGHVARKLARWRFRPEDIAECAQDLFGELRTALFDHGPAGEFWEVRFWVCLDRRLWNLAEKQQAMRDSELRLDERDEGGEDPLAQIADTAPGPEIRAEWREALTLLTENERLALYLRTVEGLPEESEDPDRPSIARVLGVTGRTVRNYLRRAEDKLRRWERGEEAK